VFDDLNCVTLFTVCNRFWPYLAAGPRRTVLLEALADEEIAAPVDPIGVRPTDLVPIIIIDAATGGRIVKAMHWGLWPFWAKERPKRPLTIARSETIHELASFREAFRKRRGVVLMQTFREKCEGKWYEFGLASGEPMLVAGIWEHRPGYDSCAVATTTPNELIGKYHDRMPCLLTQAEVNAWLDPSTDLTDLLALLRPFTSEPMKASEVASPKRAQGDLFE